MTSCLMRPALLKCYRRYVVFCKNVHMRKGHRCHRHNDLIPSYAIHYLRSFWRSHMSIWECILGRVQKFTSVNYTTQACAEHLQTHTHICHTQWFTCRVLHPGWGIRPSCLMIWVWRSSVRQRGDCWSVRTAAGFTDAQRERDRVRKERERERDSSHWWWVIVSVVWVKSRIVHLHELGHIFHNRHILPWILLKVSQHLL